MFHKCYWKLGVLREIIYGNRTEDMLRPKIKNKNYILLEMLQTVLLSDKIKKKNFDLFFMVFIAVI